MKNKKKHSLKFKLLPFLVAFLIAFVFCLWPTNYVIESPGDAIQVSEFIKSNSKKANPNFYLVTVSQRSAVMIDYLTSFLRKNETRYQEKEVKGDSSDEEYNKMQKYYMKTSQNNAIYYAAKKAGVQRKQKFLGVYVMSIFSKSSFKNKLKVGDTITSFNGKKFKSSYELIKAVEKIPEGQNVTIEVLRSTKKLTFNGKTTKLENTKRSGIGIQLLDHTEVATKPKIKIDAEEIGGPSAGLMFALESYQIFSNKNFAKGKKIAGTGTIDDSGNIGIIGGVDKKVIAANRKNIDVFFVSTDQPEGIKKSETNYYEALKTAKQIKTKMKIVPVHKFEDALNYLNRN